MTERELHQLIEKYKSLSIQLEPKDEEKSMVCERFAGFLEDYPQYSSLSDSDTEENLWENFKEAEAEVGNYWDDAFPEGIEEDEIVDWLTKE